MFHGAVRTASSIPSHWSPEERGGMKGGEWAGDSLKGDAPQGSRMLAGCPSLKKNNWRQILPQGETQMEAYSTEFSRGQVIVSPSLTSTLGAIGCSLRGGLCCGK